MSELGNRIRRLREKNGLSQEELAHRLGYTSKSTITKIEKGVNDIPQNKIVRFAECLNTTPAALMGWVDEDMSAKNDVLANIVLQLRKNDELLAMVTKLSKLSNERLQALKPVLDAYVEAGK